MVDPRDAEREKARVKAERDAARKVAAAKKRKAAAAVAKADAKRSRHTDADYEKLLRTAENRGWKVAKDDGYFKCLCPCAEKHWVGVVLTPSGSRTLMNTRKKFERATCWGSQASKKGRK